MKNETRFTEVCHLDTCLSDFFSGYSFPVLAIGVYGANKTCEELASDIEIEINMTYEYLTNEFNEDDMQVFTDFCEELRETPNKKVLNHDLEVSEDEDEDTECVYMYFSLCKPVNRYGITFLNE